MYTLGYLAGNPVRTLKAGASDASHACAGWLREAAEARPPARHDKYSKTRILRDAETNPNLIRERF